MQNREQEEEAREEEGDRGKGRRAVGGLGPHFSDFLLTMSERGGLYASLGANVVLGVALCRTLESLRGAEKRADENQLNRILIDKVESYGNLIASKLPSSLDR